MSLSPGICGSLLNCRYWLMGRVSLPKNLRSMSTTMSPLASASAMMVLFIPVRPEWLESWKSPTAPTTARYARSVFDGSTALESRYVIPAPQTS